ncbi:MAG: hypothetical protein M1519_01070 [Actinobacteria bacterium]|nr:hypothetical protein [Actinomycetota bacterium]
MPSDVLKGVATGIHSHTGRRAWAGNGVDLLKYGSTPPFHDHWRRPGTALIGDGEAVRASGRVFDPDTHAERSRWTRQ